MRSTTCAYELGKSDRSAKFRTMQDVREAR